MWAELLLFILVFIFAAHQFYDLKKEKQKVQPTKEEDAIKSGSNIKKS